MPFLAELLEEALYRAAPVSPMARLLPWLSTVVDTVSEHRSKTESLNEDYGIVQITSISTTVKLDICAI